MKSLSTSVSILVHQKLTKASLPTSPSISDTLTTQLGGGGVNLDLTMVQIIKHPSLVMLLANAGMEFYLIIFLSLSKGSILYKKIKINLKKKGEREGKNFIMRWRNHWMDYVLVYLDESMSACQIMCN